MLKDGLVLIWEFELNLKLTQLGNPEVHNDLKHIFSIFLRLWKAALRKNYNTIDCRGAQEARVHVKA